MRVGFLIVLTACGGTIEGNLDEDPPFLDAPDPMQMPSGDPLPVLDVELDTMEGMGIPTAALDVARDAFKEAGVEVRFFSDETIPVQDLDGSFRQRHNLLSRHRDDPTRVHVIVARRRGDLSTRGGEVVTDGDGDRDKAGIIIYRETLEDLHPACGGAPDTSMIVVEEALAGTLIHELGHALQLGHDTEMNGGINHYNVMSVPASCVEAQKRFHGAGNEDAQLGATQDVAEPRFSLDAVERFRLDRIIGVHTARLIDDVGVEM